MQTAVPVSVVFPIASLSAGKPQRSARALGLDRFADRGSAALLMPAWTVK
jgi:hypothetical protein